MVLKRNILLVVLSLIIAIGVAVSIVHHAHGHKDGQMVSKGLMRKMIPITFVCVVSGKKINYLTIPAIGVFRSGLLQPTSKISRQKYNQFQISGSEGISAK